MVRAVSVIRDFCLSVSGWKRFLFAFALGTGAATSMAPYYLLPLLVIGFSALVWLTDGSHRRARPGASAFWTGFAFALGYLWLSMYWLAFSFMVHATGPGHLVLLSVLGFAGVFAVSAFIALFYGVAMALAIRLWRPGWERVLTLAIAWSLAEYARGHVLTGFPWNLTGQALAGMAAFSQPVAWIGTYGLGFILLIACALPAAIAGRDGAREGAREEGRWRCRPLIGALALWLAIPLAGGLRLAGGAVALHEDIRVQVIQPNIAQPDKINPDRFLDNFYLNLEMSGGAAAEGLAPYDGGAGDQLYVIWPENAAYQYFRRDPGALALLRDRLPAGAVLITGDVRIARDGENYRFFNSLSVLSDRPLPGDGEAAPSDAGWTIINSYDKHHLAPFGEFIPLQGLFAGLGFDRVVPMGANFTPGEGPTTIDLGRTSFSPIICYETIFPGEIYPRAARPDWLVTVTNDAWFGDSAGPRQHLDMSRLRAIEAGLPMARSANTGVSAIIDPYGRIVESIDLYRRDTIVRPLPEALPPTLYHYTGDILYYLLVAIAGILTITSCNVSNRSLAVPMTR